MFWCILISNKPFAIGLPVIKVINVGVRDSGSLKMRGQQKMRGQLQSIENHNKICLKLYLSLLFQPRFQPKANDGLPGFSWSEVNMEGELSSRACGRVYLTKYVKTEKKIVIKASLEMRRRDLLERLEHANVFQRKMLMFLNSKHFETTHSRSLWNTVHLISIHLREIRR